MSDEVTRLRRLRKKALQVRAMALYLNASQHQGGIYARAALVNWRIARIATGKLRSHPYGKYQRDPGLFESVTCRFRAYLKATLGTIRGRGMRFFLAEIGSSARELDDARALTLSAELSDALGRAQESMRSVIEQLRCELRGGGAQESCEPAQACSEPRASLSTSPYLAI